MRKLLTALLFVLLLAVLVYGDQFHRLVSITGGSGQRLSTSLATAGYTGPVSMDEITLCVPSSNVNTMYLGDTSSVNASTGFPLAPGDCITYRMGARIIDVSGMYVFVASTENLAVSLRSR